MSKLTNARYELHECLQAAARDVPDWGSVPDPTKWLKAIEALIDAKIEASKGSQR